MLSIGLLYMWYSDTECQRLAPDPGFGMAVCRRDRQSAIAYSWGRKPDGWYSEARRPLWVESGPSTRDISLSDARLPHVRLDDSWTPRCNSAILIEDISCSMYVRAV